MSEELTEAVEQQEDQQEQKGPSIEDIAKEQGWNPNHEGPDKIDAAEFVRRKPLFDKIKAQNKELKEIKKSVDLMAQTYKSMSEAQYKRGIADADKRMKAAEEALDIDGYKEAAADKALLETSHTDIKGPVPPEVEDFCARNPWFDNDPIMQTDALEYREKYIKRNPDASLSDVLKYVEIKIKKDYPEKFEQSPKEVKKPSAAAVEDGTPGASVSSDPLIKLKNSMSPEERRVMKMFTGSGQMTETEYLKSYAEVREK